MILKKHKKQNQVTMLISIQSRLCGMADELIAGGEPMLSIRLSALLTELRTAIENSEA